MTKNPYCSTLGKNNIRRYVQSARHLPDAKHYVVCVDENGKTGATPIGATIIE